MHKKVYDRIFNFYTYQKYKIKQFLESGIGIWKDTFL